MRAIESFTLRLAAALVATMLLPAMASAQVRLNTWTTPDTGVAGVTFVNVIGSSFPTSHGAIAPGAVTVSFSLTCGGAPAATALASSVRAIIGSSSRIQVQLPGSLATGIYFVSLNGTTGDGTPFSSLDCSKVNVTHSNPTLSACVPTSSLAILAPPNPGQVKAYVPNASWGGGATGVQAVPIEGGGAPVSIATAGPVNSCSSNPATGQTVCVANGNDVYLITGNSLTNTLTSGSTGFASFSGGSCKNCGVAVNALSNQAVINMGVLGAPSGDGIQVLNLNTNTFNPPIPLTHDVSEDISIDPTRGYVLTPNENSFYDLVRFVGGVGTEFTHATPGGFHDWDSAAEDCSTGIALSVGEFTSDVYLTDLTQATFNTVSHTWTAPERIVTLAASFSAGASAVTVAPGSAHLGVVTGEFGGQAFAVIKLPSTSGTGTPDILDYAYVPNIPLLPNPAGGFFPSFSAGLDPHTTTAYTSANDGKAYAVFANSPPPSYLVVADMAAVLAAPRNAGTHTVTAAGITALVSSGALRGVSTH